MLSKAHAAGFVLLLLFLSHEPGVALDREGWEALKQPVKAFALKDLEGRTLTPRDLAGKVAVVDFWATWCGPCIAEIPELEAWNAKLESRKDVVFLSFSVTEEKAAVVFFAKKRKLSFPVYLADELSGAFEIVSFPTKVVIDFRKQPTLRYRHEGIVSIASIEQKVESLLAEKN